VQQGISLGCPLSPLMGAVYLKRLDERMEASGAAYARFMDDWVILAPTRWKLRAAVRLVNETLAELHVHQHPDRTFIGRPAGGLTSWVICLLPRELRSPRAPWSVAWCVCPGFMSRVWTWSASGPALVAGNAGPGAGCRRWEKNSLSGPTNSRVGHSAATVCPLALVAAVPDVCGTYRRRCPRASLRPPSTWLTARGESGQDN